MKCAKPFFGAVSFLVASMVSMPLAFGQVTHITLSDSDITPNQFTVQKGQTVNMLIRNAGTRVHNFVLPDFYVFSPNLQPGATTTASFQPDKTGQFVYYSDKKGVPEPGIKGTLTVRDNAPTNTATTERPSSPRDDLARARYNSHVKGASSWK